MKRYYRVTAYTPYCGEELTKYIVTEFENELMQFAQGVLADCIGENITRHSEFESYGFADFKDWADEYEEKSDVRIEEITLEEWLKEAFE